MTVMPPTRNQLLQENADLRHRLEEAEATIRAISAGEVDAFLVRRGAEDQVLVLDGVDRPYRLLIEQMNQGAVTLTSDGTIAYANRSLALLLDVAPRSLLNASFFTYVAPDDHPALKEVLYRGQFGDAGTQLLIRRPDGSGVRVGISAAPLLEAAGMLCMTVTDLTEQLQQAREREEFVHEQTARAAAEYTAMMLRDADERKDEFLAMLAHELRGPLAPLRTGLEVLNQIGAQTPITQSIREMLTRQVDSLVRLVDDLLDVSRVTQGRIELSKEWVDLRDVIQHAVESVTPLIAKRSHRFGVTLPPEAVPVHADRTRMAQVVINLLSNAAKFTPPEGTIALTVERDVAAGEAVVRVRDTGVGIEPDQLPRMFELFAQGDPSISRSEGGLGIGLTLSRRLMEMHNGTIQGLSRGRGQGSEFVARLPYGDPTMLTAPGTLGPLAIPLARRILIVDDNRDAARSLAALLTLRGHEVRQEYDGPRGLAAAEEFEPDLLLLDIGLPEMDGYEVARRVRSRERLRTLTMVAVSGYGGDDQRQRSLAAGFTEHLVKPVDGKRIDALLASLQ